MNNLYFALVLGVLLFLGFLESANKSLFHNERDIVFSSSDSSIQLSGTVSVPAKTPPRAAAVILPVAGPSDRDGTLGPHKFYKSLAQSLGKNGIATLRFDTRGMGQSGGNILDTNLDERASDACKAMNALKMNLDLAEVNVGFIGISEGGGIGMVAASKCNSVDFVVLLSTPIRKGKEVVIDQMERMIDQSPLPEKQKTDLAKELIKFLDLVSVANPHIHREEIHKILSGPYGNFILPPYHFIPTTIERKVDFVLSPWYQSQLHYDIREILSGTDYPLLSLYGNLDYVIDPHLNLNLLKELRPDVNFEMKKGLNHLLQQANTGSPAEYTSLPGAISEAVVSDIAVWLKKLDK